MLSTEERTHCFCALSFNVKIPSSSDKMATSIHTSQAFSSSEVSKGCFCHNLKDANRFLSSDALMKTLWIGAFQDELAIQKH